MPSRPEGEEQRTYREPDLVTFGQMPERLAAAGLPRLTHQRCRQLAETDPAWPIPMDQAVRVGRMRLFDWTVLEPYFRERKSRQGERTDLRRDAAEGDTDGGDGRPE